MLRNLLQALIKDQTQIRPSRAPLAISLEARMMFDGAVAATVADTAADSLPDADAEQTSADTLAATPTNATSDQRQDVVFIDSQVADKQQLIAALKPGVEVVVLDGSRDGLQQITQYLQGRQGLDAIHIFSHGEQGVLKLGTTMLDSLGAEARAADLAAIGNSLTLDGDILLYGCDIGRDAAGALLVEQLATLTRADIAASTDRTGATARGGNWELERRSGEIATHALFDTVQLANYDNLLALPSAEQLLGQTYWQNNTGGNTVDGFNLNATPGAVIALDPDVIYFQSSPLKDGNNNHYYELTWTADGVDLGTFDLKQITITEYGSNYQVWIRAHSGGADVTETINTTNSSALRNINLVGFNDISSFTIRVTNIAGTNQFANVDFVKLTLEDLKGPNAAPMIGNLNGDNAAWAGVGNTVRVDVGSNASLSDTELGALNGGSGDWAGASLVLQRNGTAVSSDVLGFDTSGALFTVNGNNLQRNGLTFATFTNTGGVLTVNFNSSATTASTALVNDVAQRLTYRSDTPAGDANMRLTVNDGAGGSTSANLTVASNTIYVTSDNDTATIDHSDGTSFREAIAIAALDTTGSQTIVFAGNLAGQTLNISNVTISESLTFDLDSASGIVLTGGTITLGGGTTQTFSNGSGDSASINNVITGTGALTKAGSGTLTLGGIGNAYSGATTISAGTLRVTGGDALSSNAAVTVGAGATLALASNETIGSLSGAGSVTLDSHTLSIDLTANSTFSGGISGTGGLTVNQAGSATYALTLTGNNTYTGATTLSNYAWLRLDGDSSMSDSSAIRVNGNSVLSLLSQQTIGSLSSDNANARIQLGTYTLSTGGDNTSTTIAGVLSGTGTLVKQGAGTLTLTGSNAYGATTVSAGTLSIDTDSNLGTGAVRLADGAVLNVTGATAIDNAIVLTGNSTVSHSNALTLSGAISGAYSLSKTGSGTLILTGSNSYGATYINAGTLSVGSDANLGSGAVNLAAGATLALTNTTNVDNAIVLSGNATLATSANVTVSGVISGAYTLTKSGSSSLTLSGTNTYAATTVSAGTLSISSDANLGSGALTLNAGTTLSVTGATTVDNAITLAGNATLNSVAATTLSGVISGSNNLTKTGAATLTLSGSNTYSGSTNIATGTLSIASDANLGTGTVNLAHDAALQITGNTTIDNAVVLTGIASINTGAAATLSGVIGGTGGLNKTGNGTLTLTGNNTYSYSTSVSAGTLAVDGSINTSTVVHNGATLAGTGALGNSVDVELGGTLSPGGANAGTLTIMGNLNLQAGSTLALNINGATAGSGYDQIRVTGTVDVSGANLAVTHGYAPGNGDSYTVIDNDAADAITGTFTGISNGSTLIAGGNGTALTANYAGATGNDLILTAPTGPTVVGVSSDAADGAYKIGDTILITVQFSTMVTVTGAPTLTLETGTTDRAASYISGSGSNTLIFSYTVQAGDVSADLNYVSNSALNLNGGSIEDAEGRAATLGLPASGTAGALDYSKALVVDGIQPTILTLTINKTSMSAGEQAIVTFTFSERVTGVGLSNFSTSVGTVSGFATSDNGVTWTATLNLDADVTNAASVIDLNTTGIKDLAGNSATGSKTSDSFAVDTKRPTATITISETTLRAGQTATVTVTFSEAVNGLDTADFTLSNGWLSTPTSIDGGITWTSTLTPASNASSLINVISLDNTLYTDHAGNTGTGNTSSSNYAVDTIAPSATSLNLADNSLKAGQTTTLTITFNEVVTDLEVDDFIVANGSLSDLTSSDGGKTWTATLTPLTDVHDATNLVILDNSKYTDAAGNPGVGISISNNYTIDTRVPRVTSVSTPAGATYVGSDNLDFIVNFDEEVLVDTTTGTPRLAITVDNGDIIYADYLSGSGSSSLVFRLTLGSGYQDDDGVVLGNQLLTNGATLRDSVGNDIATALNNVGSTSVILLDSAPPQVTAITLDDPSSTSNTTLGFTVTFSEPVQGVDLSDFTLAISGGVTGTLQSLRQIDARTYQIIVSDVAGQGTLGLSLTASGSGILDNIGHPLQSNFTSPVYRLNQVNSDSNRPVTVDIVTNPPITPDHAPQPTSPIMPPAVVVSPLMPAALFEHQSLGSGLPSVPRIFARTLTLSPSFIAQVFSSSADNILDTGNSGLSDFSDGDADVFGTSSFSRLFSRQTPPNVDLSERGVIPEFGSPTLGEQLREIGVMQRSQIDNLANALEQLAAQRPAA